MIAEKLQMINNIGKMRMILNYLNLYRFYFLTGFTPVKSASLLFLEKNLTGQAGFLGF
jgi:hypothetical protein